MTEFLDKIDSPADVRAMALKDLPGLAQDVRERIIRVVEHNGGHLGSNLGTVELTIALHYCYDFAVDRLVWDVGHQAYTHKLLTGRRDRFDTLRCEGGLSGFPNIDESPFDPFTSGHSGTAISTALGLVHGDRVAGRERSVVACIGDGAMASGMPFEALNHAGHLGRDLLVVLNDNDMSIANTVGALGSYLSRIRAASVYRDFKHEVHRMLDALPVFGKRMASVLEHLKEIVRRSMVPGAMFEEMGFKYYGPVDGHNIEKLVSMLSGVRELRVPVLLHVITEKGRGHPAAADHPHRLHSAGPASNGKVRLGAPSPRPSYTQVCAEALVERARHDERVVAITPAMPGIASPFAEEFPKRYFDVGICEQHALGLAAGLSAAGMRPVIAIYSTFLQRAYDQIFHEICLQRANVVLAIDRGGIVGTDGPTHHGVFDIAYLRHLPGITLMAPKDGPELAAMLEFAIDTDGPVAIRIPRDNVPEPSDPAPIEMGVAEVVRNGGDVVLWAYGSMVAPALAAADLLDAAGIAAAVVNARFAKPIDVELLGTLVDRPIVTIEEGVLNGGAGSAVLEALNEAGLDANVTRLGVPDRFIEHASRDSLLKQLGLSPEGIRDAATAIIGRKA